MTSIGYKNDFFGYDNDFCITTTLVAPLLNAEQRVTNTLDWVHGILTSIGTVVNNLRNPTPFVIEKIDNKLFKNVINLTQAIMTKPGEDNTLLLQILTKIQEDLLSLSGLSKLPNLVIDIAEKGMNKMKDKASRPTTPNMTEEMLQKMESKIENLKQKIDEAEKKHQNLNMLKKTKALPGHTMNQMRRQKKLKAMVAEFETHLVAAQNHAPVEKPSWGTVDKILHQIVKTLLNQLCVERNLGNLLGLFLKELTKVITSIQDVDLIGSESIEKDFIKRLSGNVNVNVEKFFKERDKSLKDNLTKLALNITKKAGKEGPIFSHPIFSIAAEALVERVLGSLIKVFSDEVLIKMSKILTEILEKISCFKSDPDSDSDYNSKLFQEILKNGVQCGSVNIQFPKAPSQCLLNQEQFAYFKNNINLLMPTILYTLITVLVDGLANYIDIDLNLDASVSRALSDKENKMMQSDVNKNFTALISAIQPGIDNIFHYGMGETSKFRYSRIELFEALFVKTPLVLGRLFIRAIIPENAVQRTISTAVILAGYEMKRIKIAEIIPGLAKYLGEIAKT